MLTRSALGSFAFALSSLLVPSAASAIHYERNGRSGEIIVARDYASWDQNCQSLGGAVSPVTKPAHGKLTTRQVTTIPKMSRFNPNDPCLGRKIRGVLVEYRSEPGFKGVDSFSVRAFWGGAQKGDTDTFTVNVR